MADTTRGAIPVDFTVPNRSISAPLMLADSYGGTTPAQARAAIQAKVALLQREGGWLKRITNSGGTVYADIVNASFRATSVSGWESRQNIDTGASLELEAIPDFYEDETTDADNSTTTARELIFTKAMTGEGDNPNRVRLVVDNDGTTDWRGLIWSVRCRHYHPEATAQSEYEAEELTNLDTARVLALSGASGGTAITHGTISTNWTPVVGTNYGGTFLTHTGTNRIFARVYSTSGTLVQSRFVWDVGDLTLPAENDSFRLPGASNFYIVDYGEVRLDQSPVGAHRWQGQIQAKGDVGTENFSVDKVWIANCDEGWGVLTASLDTGIGLSTYTARSEFNTETGAITGDSLAAGGTWSFLVGGDADDFSAAGGVATRTAVSDATARVNRAGVSALTETMVSVDLKLSAAVDVVSGVVARITDFNNLCYAAVTDATSSTIKVVVEKAVGGALTTLGQAIVPFGINAFYTITLEVGANGLWAAYFGPQGAELQLVAAGSDTALATGGSLASGGIGLHDKAELATAVTRTYDNFAAWVPSKDAVVFDGQSAQLTTQGMLREDAGGTAYGPVSVSDGALPRFPVPAQAGGTVETLLVPSTGDFCDLPDTFGTASISARATRRPSWLFVGDS